MDLKEAIEKRHSVRQYTDKKIESEIEEDLRLTIENCNEESGLNIQLCLNEEKAFNEGILAKISILKNVKNYIAIVGKKSDDVKEKVGYYGEKVVLKATQLGLNTCWAASGYKKSKICAKIANDEKLFIVIAIGYGVNDGNPRKTKHIDKLGNINNDSPQWFIDGLKSAQLAPTARNQQRFKFILSGNIVEANALFGFLTKIDLGIAKYHFEIGANSKEWSWKT
jgi:nitroreductase